MGGIEGIQSFHDKWMKKEDIILEVKKEDENPLTKCQFPGQIKRKPRLNRCQVVSGEHGSKETPL